MPPLSICRITNYYLKYIICLLKFNLVFEDNCIIYYIFISITHFQIYLYKNLVSFPAKI